MLRARGGRSARGSVKTSVGHLLAVTLDLRARAKRSGPRVIAEQRFVRWPFGLAQRCFPGQIDVTSPLWINRQEGILQVPRGWPCVRKRYLREALVLRPNRGHSPRFGQASGIMWLAIGRQNTGQHKGSIVVWRAYLDVPFRVYFLSEGFHDSLESCGSVERVRIGNPDM